MIALELEELGSITKFHPEGEFFKETLAATHTLLAEMESGDSRSFSAWAGTVAGILTLGYLIAKKEKES